MLEELLKDSKSKELLNSIIHEYIKNNLSISVTSDRHDGVEIQVYLNGECICEAEGSPYSLADGGY